MLQGLQSDLIATQALCDLYAVAEDEVRAAVCRLPGSPSVITREPQTLSEVLASIRQVATAVDVDRRVNEVIGGLVARVETVVARTAALQRHPRVALLEWLDPPLWGSPTDLPDLAWRILDGGLRGVRGPEATL